jgi:exosortase B
MSTSSTRGIGLITTRPRRPDNGLLTQLKIDPGYLPWLIIALGLLVVYVPSFYSLFTSTWNTNEQSPGPIVLGISLWLLYRQWPKLSGSMPVAVGPVGWPLLVLGLAFYIVGRSQDIQAFEIGSLILVASAVALLLRGVAGLRSIRLPLFFMCFLIPLPGTFVSAVTLPFSIAVSSAVDNVLYAAGYPIAREGVILQLGQYQLLVATACAGLRTLFALEALGFVYLQVVRHSSLRRNLLLAVLILPISFAANVVRVILLSLITYHFGEGAGRGFLHDFAGIVLFTSALILIIAADWLLRPVSGGRNPAHAP